MSIGVVGGDDDWNGFARQIAASVPPVDLSWLAEQVAASIRPTLDAMNQTIADLMPTLIDIRSIVGQFSAVNVPMYQDIARSLQPLLAQIASTQVQWMPNVTAIVSGFATTIDAAEARAHTAAAVARPVVEQDRALVTPKSLRPLSPAEMKKVLRAAGVVLGGWWATAQGIDYLCGDATTPADELMWAAALLYGLMVLIVSAVEFDRDQ